MENSINRPVNRPAQSPASAGGRTNTGGRRPAKTGARSNQQTGITPRPNFSWQQISGRAPAASQLSWLGRQASENLNVARARIDADLTTEDVTMDERTALAARGRDFVRGRTDLAKNAAARGVANNAALTGARHVDLTDDHATDTKDIALEAMRRREALEKIVADAEQQRLESQINILIEAGDLVAADRLVKGL